MLQERLEERARTGSRHPGHLDDILLQEFSANSDADFGRTTDSGRRTMLVDTTHFGDIDYHNIFMEIENALKSSDEDRIQRNRGLYYKTN